MSKKKKKNKQNTTPRKPEAPKPPRGNPENIIMIELPDPPEAKAPEPEKPAKDKRSPEKTQPEKKRDPVAPKVGRVLSNAASFLKEKTAAVIGKVKSARKAKNGAPVNTAQAKSAKAAAPVKAVKTAPANTVKTNAASAKTKKTAAPEANDNSENTIKIELPDSEAEKLMTVVPQVTSEEKPPLTPEQIAAKKHRTRLVISKTADIVLFVVLTIVGLLILFPIFFAAVQSLKSTAELGDVPQTFFPKRFTLGSFGGLLTSTGKTGVPFYRFAFNTVFLVVVVTALRIAVTVPAAYVLAKVKAPMIKTLNRLVELSLALTPALAYVLNYVLIAKTSMADTWFAMILPFITSPLCLILIRGAIRRIPDDMISAARLEGASHPMILRKLVAPQIKPAIAATVILSLLEMGRISGGVLTFSETLDTLPAYMERLYERGAAGEMYALALLMLIPAVVLFVIFRKSILQTMTTAMLKDKE